MNNMDKYYQILGLNPGASEEEIKEAYKDLISVWHPDRFDNDPRMKEKANEKLREINLAYEVVRAYIAGKSEQSTESRERRNHAESQPPPHEPSPKADEEQTSIRPPPKQPFSQAPPHVSPIRQVKQAISYLPLSFFFGVIGGAIGRSITNLIHFSPDEAFIYGGGIPAILFGVGSLIGVGIVKIINGMEKPRKHRVRLAWGAAVIGGLLFPLTSWFILSPFLENWQPRTSSSVRPPITTPSEESTSKEDPFLAYLREKEQGKPPTGGSSSTEPSPKEYKRPDWMTDAFLASSDIPTDMIWKSLGTNSQGSTFYYDTKYTLRLENINRVGVWTKIVYSDKAITRFGNNREKVAYSIESNLIDCLWNTASRGRAFHYSKEGVCIDYSKTPSEWISIPPNTVLAVLQKEVCR